MKYIRAIYEIHALWVSNMRSYFANLRFLLNANNSLYFGFSNPESEIGSEVETPGFVERSQPLGPT